MQATVGEDFERHVSAVDHGDGFGGNGWVGMD